MLARRLTETPPLTRLRDEMEWLFDRFLRDDEPFREILGVRRFPAVNVWQDPDNLFVEAEMPGLSEHDFEVFVTNKVLTIKGRRPDIDKPEGTIVHRHERGTGAFQRVINLPMSVDDDEIDAVFHDGVLMITLPKAEVEKPHRVLVKAQEEKP